MTLTVCELLLLLLSLVIVLLVSVRVAQRLGEVLVGFATLEGQLKSEKEQKSCST